jgi:hypothetical protein
MPEYFRIRSFLIIVLSAIMLLGCNDGSEHKTNPVAQSSVVDSDDIAISKKKIMSLHNQTMAKMDSMMLLKSELNTLLKTGDFSNENDKKAVKSGIEALENANNAMMDWMHQYKTPDKKWEHEKARTYLDDQYTKILNVKKEMDMSMQNARQAILQSKRSK